MVILCIPKCWIRLGKMFRISQLIWLLFSTRKNEKPRQVIVASLQKKQHCGFPIDLALNRYIWCGKKILYTCSLGTIWTTIIDKSIVYGMKRFVNFHGCSFKCCSLSLYNSYISTCLHFSCSDDFSLTVNVECVQHIPVRLTPNIGG